MIILMSNISVIVLITALITVLSVLITVQYFNFQGELQTFKVQDLTPSSKTTNCNKEGLFASFVIMFVGLWILIWLAVMPRVINYLW